MSVLVTGGSGFIGNHLVPLLAESGFEDVRVIDRQRHSNVGQIRCRFYEGDFVRIISEQPEVLSGVDVVFHLAWASIHESSTRDPVHDINANLVPTIRLLEQCVLKRVKRVVFLSSGGTVYGLPKYLPISEDHPTEPISAYGISKLAVEKYLALFYRLYGLEYAILRPSVPYGEYQSPFGRQGAVAVFFGRILQHKPIVIWGDAEETVRDFFHVTDLVRACVLAANSDRPTGIYNLGGETGISLASLIDAMSEIVGPRYAIEIQSTSSRPFDVPKVVLDISRASRLLDWKPEIDLTSGLQRTWEWLHALPVPTALRIK